MSTRSGPRSPARMCVGLVTTSCIPFAAARRPFAPRAANFFAPYFLRPMKAASPPGFVTPGRLASFAFSAPNRAPLPNTGFAIGGPPTGAGITSPNGPGPGGTCGPRMGICGLDIPPCAPIRRFAQYAFNAAGCAIASPPDESTKYGFAFTRFVLIIRGLPVRHLLELRVRHRRTPRQRQRHYRAIVLSFGRGVAQLPAGEFRRLERLEFADEDRIGKNRQLAVLECEDESVDERFLGLVGRVKGTNWKTGFA